MTHHPTKTNIPKVSFWSNRFDKLCGILPSLHRCYRWLGGTNNSCHTSTYSSIDWQSAWRVISSDGSNYSLESKEAISAQLVISTVKLLISSVETQARLYLWLFNKLQLHLKKNIFKSTVYMVNWHIYRNDIAYKLTKTLLPSQLVLAQNVTATWVIFKGCAYKVQDFAPGDHFF